MAANTGTGRSGPNTGTGRSGDNTGTGRTRSKFGHSQGTGLAETSTKPDDLSPGSARRARSERHIPSHVEFPDETGGR